jgi:hypothetical protein
MKNSTKILLGIGSVALVVVAILGVLGIIDSETAMGVGAMMCAAPPAATAASTDVSGSVGTHTVNADKSISHPEMNKETISQKLSKVLPSNYPLDTFLRNIGSGKTNSDKYGFYSIVARGVEAILGTASANSETALGASQVLTLSSGVHCLSKDGDLLVPSYNVANGKATAAGTGKVALNPLVLHIIDINYSEKKITVMGVNAPIPASIATGTKFYRMASAKDQDAAMSNDPMATPTKDFNFVQRNLCTISENAFQALQDKEVAYGMAEFKEQALLDFRYQAEITSLFGAAYAANDGEMIDASSQKRKLHMKGLTSFIGTQVTKTDGQTVTQFLNEAMEELFANNNGSEERIILYGAEFATALANDAEAWKKQIEGAKTEIKWGITWKVIETNFGRLLGLMHTGLGMVGYGNCAFVIDPANIRRINQLELTQTELDLKKAGQRNSKDITLDEAWTLEVTNPSCHGMLVIPA